MVQSQKSPLCGLRLQQTGAFPACQKHGTTHGRIVMMQVGRSLLSRGAALAAAGVMTVVLTAGAAIRSEAKPGGTSVKIGAKINVKTFRDIEGKSYTLGQKGSPAVYFFLGTQCPVANLYTPRILALQKAYGLKS